MSARVLSQSLKTYIALYRQFFKTSAIADLEFRMNFSVRLFTDIIWIIAQIFMFETLYRHTDIIGTWNLEQTRVFLGILFIVDAGYMVLFSQNLDQFSDKVSKGDLDLLLTKPVNSQFIISLQRVSVANIGNLIIAFAWFAWSLYQYSGLSWTKMLWLLVLIPNGIIVTYAVRFMFSSLSILFTRAENLQFIFFQFYKMAMRPDGIYFPWLRWILMTIMPMAMIASVPSRIVLDEPNFGLLAWALAIGPVFLLISSWFWSRVLRHYSSASS